MTLRCTGCGSTQTIAEIRAERPRAISCCPERDMQPHDWVIIKRGLFYRPQRQGYTANIEEAGRYTRKEAEETARGRRDQGVTAAPASDFDRSTERTILVAKAICAETCAFMGEPPCWRFKEDNQGNTLKWPPVMCNEPGCMALAMVACEALSKTEKA